MRSQPIPATHTVLTKVQIRANAPRRAGSGSATQEHQQAAPRPVPTLPATPPYPPTTALPRPRRCAPLLSARPPSACLTACGRPSFIICAQTTARAPDRRARAPGKARRRGQCPRGSRGAAGEVVAANLADHLVHVITVGGGSAATAVAISQRDRTVAGDGSRRRNVAAAAAWHGARSSATSARSSSGPAPPAPPQRLRLNKCTCSNGQTQRVSSGL